MTEQRNKSALARAMGVSRASLYYRAKQPAKDWALKVRIEEELCELPSYGSRNLAIALRMGRERVRRVMRLFGIKPYRRHGKRYRKRKVKQMFPNLLLESMPSYPHHIWATDFTELMFRGQRVYISTILDIFTRRIIAVHVAVRKGAALSVETLMQALMHCPKPAILHSDNGREYMAKAFMDILEACGIAISRSAPGCPWENGYQESFYDKFKVDFGDPNRWKTLGELVAEIHRAIWTYNHTRIHSALRMPPAVFAERLAA
ncbi:MAG: IS3 family transposase [Candidatus Acidiferrales bacterium]